MPGFLKKYVARTLSNKFTMEVFIVSVSPVQLSSKRGRFITPPLKWLVSVQSVGLEKTVPVSIAALTVVSAAGR